MKGIGLSLAAVIVASASVLTFGQANVKAAVSAVEGTPKVAAQNVQVKNLCDGFAPANTMSIPVGAKFQSRFATGGGITEQQFNAVMDRIQLLYADIIKARGGELQINRLWSDGTVNASAQQIGGKWILNMYGGLARHPVVTPDAMALVACHEMGHHLGGAPKIKGYDDEPEWAANEGGADYFGTLKCGRRFFEDPNNAAIVKGLNVDPLAAAKCEEQFSNVDQQLICKRETVAATALTKLLAELGGDAKAPTVGTPDKSVVDETYDGHPAAQCRLDTYFAGAGCKADVTSELSETDYRQGSCVAPQDAFGFRSTCWFKPD